MAKAGAMEKSTPHHSDNALSIGFVSSHCQHNLLGSRTQSFRPLK